MRARDSVPEISPSASERPAKVAPGWTKPFERMSSNAAHDVSTRTNLRELSGEKKSFRMHEGVLKGVDINIGEKETLNATVLIHRVTGHLHLL